MCLYSGEKDCWQHPKIVDNILFAQELAKGFHRETSKEKVCIKLTISKAFDSVNWKYIIMMLERFEFGSKFISWIWACTSTPSFAIFIHGEPAKTFSSCCGLRQGDPLSPLLFTLAMEGGIVCLVKICSSWRENSSILHSPSYCSSSSLCWWCSPILQGYFWINQIHGTGATRFQHAVRS